VSTVGVDTYSEEGEGEGDMVTGVNVPKTPLKCTRSHPYKANVRSLAL